MYAALVVRRTGGGRGEDMHAALVVRRAGGVRGGDRVGKCSGDGSYGGRFFESKCRVWCGVSSGAVSLGGRCCASGCHVL
jgi:hypothetical protein